LHSMNINVGSEFFQLVILGLKAAMKLTIFGDMCYAETIRIDIITRRGVHVPTIFRFISC
jgi:hypothetical protein